MTEKTIRLIISILGSVIVGAVLLTVPLTANAQGALGAEETVRNADNEWHELVAQYTVLFQVKQYENSIDIVKQALSAADLLFGPEAPRTVQNMNDLGYAYRMSGEYEDAAYWHERALEIRLRHLTEDDPSVTQARTNLAKDYYFLKRYDDAMELFEASERALVAHMGPESYWLGVIYDFMARIEDAQGHAEAAGTFYDKALAAYRSELRDSDPRFDDIVARYAANLRSRGMEAAAEALELRHEKLNAGGL